MPAEALQKTAPTLSGPGGPAGDDHPRGGDGRTPDGLLGDPARFGLWAFMGTATMLFIGFTSAYIVRRASADWQELAVPSVLWLNTGALVLSSATLEAARRRLRGWQLGEARRWLALTGILGLLFVSGQIAGWRQLSARGIFLASNPHSSFFYLLTGVHGVHLLGGLCWFGALWSQMRGLALRPGEDRLGLFATYWHFLAIVWVYLLFLLFVL